MASSDHILVTTVGNLMSQEAHRKQMAHSKWVTNELFIKDISREITNINITYYLNGATFEGKMKLY